MPIDRCACRNISFADLKRIAQADGLTVDQLSAQTGCGKQCGSCLPYLKRMLETGESSFTEILPFDPPSSLTVVRRSVKKSL